MGKKESSIIPLGLPLFVDTLTTVMLRSSNHLHVGIRVRVRRFRDFATKVGHKIEVTDQGSSRKVLIREQLEDPLELTEGGQQP